MIYCTDYSDARMTAINLLSDNDCTIKTLRIIENDKGFFWVDYENFDPDFEGR